LNYYRELLQQSSRVEPFRRAIQSVVGPDDRVLEVGAGIGTYSFFAADAGAARVWAVEGAPIIHVAETIAKLNGYAGRVEFLRGWVPDVPIPERATVLIYEDFPSRLIDAPTFRLLGKLRERYLSPDAVFVPGRARLLAVPVHLDSSVVQALTPLGGADDVLYGVDWAPSREYVINSVHRVTVPPDSVTQIPAVFSDISLSVQPAVEDIGGAASWTYQQETIVNGLVYWFDLELVPGEWISNAPGALPGSWRQLFLPLDPPLVVPAGGSLRAGVKPERLTDGAPGWLSWWANAGGSDVRGHEFAGNPASFADLYGESPDAKPRLSERGQIEARVLQLVDGERSVSDIAADLRTTFDGLTLAEAEQLVVGALHGKTLMSKLTDVAQGFPRP
jgi:hypothetical protein